MIATLPEPPRAPTVAVDAPSVIEPGAPDWVSVNVWLLMVRVAVRALTELMAATVQLTVLPEVVRVSHAGAPVTDQEVKSDGVGVTAKLPVPPVGAAAAEAALSATEPTAPACVSV